MPLLLSESLPSPTVKSYVLLSSVIFTISLIYGKGILEDEANEGMLAFEVIQADSFCLWAGVNMVYCCLFSFGKLLEHVIFGQLTPQEQQHLHDKFWNYVFYKIIFIFGVVNAQTFDEVMCWTAWFSLLGFWHIFGQLSKDRYETLTSSPHTDRKDHVKLFGLLVFISLSGFVLIGVVTYNGFANGWNTLAFVVAECLLLSLKSLQIIIKYTIQLQDISMLLWEKKSVSYYYLDLGIELGILAIDMAHHLHMLIWSNVFLSMASLVLYWNIQKIFNDFKKRWKKHIEFKLIVKNVENRFPLATDEELKDYKDSCAICWEDIVSGRRLPCSHIYHHACLCSWLQQDVSCPICRRSLTTALGIPSTTPVVDAEQLDVQPFVEQQQGNHRNHFFHFDGSRIASWFPSFSVEVFRAMSENGQDLESMAQQVMVIFPTVPHEDIMTDLRQTQSAELTIANIVEGNILIPADDNNSQQNHSDSAIEDLSEDDTDEIDEREIISELHIPHGEERDTDRNIHDESSTVALMTDDSLPSSCNEEQHNTNSKMLTSSCRRTQDLRRRAKQKNQSS